MKTEQLQYRRQNDRNGYAMLLGLLVVVVIGMFIYYTRMYGPIYQIGSGESNINPPWRQWEQMQNRLRKQAFGPPAKDQPQIPQALIVKTIPIENDKDRGTIDMIILANGSIQADWKGRFFVDDNRDIEFEVMTCRPKGNIDPQQIYNDSNGDNQSKLFFLTKGSYVILETNNDTMKVRNLMGSAYIRGWIDKNYAVTGELIITTDEKHFYLYTFGGWAEKKL
ncbi:hypothetical protein ACFL3G_06425 [Planctomycetota bacterium]